MFSNAEPAGTTLGNIAVFPRAMLRTTIFALICAPLWGQTGFLEPVRAETAEASRYGGFQSSVEPAYPPQGRYQMGTIGTAAHPDYQIGPLDVLEVVVYDAPEFGITPRVRPDGTIRMPLLKELIKIGGLTPPQAEDEIARVLQAEGMMVEPIVTVGVREHYARPVLVTGAVNFPTMLQAVGPTNLLEAIAEARGFQATAGEWILIEKLGAEGEIAETTRILVEDFKHGLNGAQEFVLHGGEKVRVLQSPTAYIIGGGRSSGPVPVRSGLGSDVLEFLAEAGVNPSSLHRRLVIFRSVPGDDDTRTHVELDLNKIQKLETTSIHVREDDIVYFPENRRLAERGFLGRLADTAITQSVFQSMWLLWR